MSLTSANGTVTLLSKEGDKKLNKDIVSVKSIGSIQEEDQPVGTWVSLFKHNRVATNGMNLSYIPPL